MLTNKILKTIFVLLTGFALLFTGAYAALGDNISDNTKSLKPNLDTVKANIETREMVMKQELANKPKQVQERMKKQNTVRLAIHNLLDMENFTGKVGPQISAIAKEFNNSIQATINAEEKIQNRSGFTRILAGGDHKAASELRELASQNKIKAQEMKELINTCGENCSEEAKIMLQEQIRALEVEQSRLSKLADTELKSKGIFGWIWK